MSYQWQFNDPVDLEQDKSLQSLIQFYVLETPVPHTSKRGYTFSQLGITGSAYVKLHAEMRKITGFPNSNGNDWVKTTAKEIVNVLSKMRREKRYTHKFEFAVHTAKDGFGKTEALFYLIRNAFAHGSFRITVDKGGERYFAFETRQGEELKGRALFKESTLLLWRDLLIEKRTRGMARS